MPDARRNDSREYDDRDRGDGRPRIYGERERDGHDPRDSLIHDLDLPRGEERELVVDRHGVYALRIWKTRKAALREELDRSERAAKAIREKLDRLDEASFSNARSTSTRTTATPRNCARSSRWCGSTVTPGSSKNST